MCTAWTRGGYTFDGCIHWLMGSSPGTNLHRMWRELHAFQGRRFVEWDEYMGIRTPSGATFTIFTDPDRLEREMLRLGPEDADLIRGLYTAIRKMSVIDMPVTYEKLGLFERLSYLLPYVAGGGAMRKWGSLSIQEFCTRLRSPALREAFDTLYGGSLPDFPVVGLIMMLAFMHKKSNGYPISGSLEFVRAIERRYLELVDRIRYGTRVERVLVENDRAVSVAAARAKSTGPTW